MTKRKLFLLILIFIFCDALVWLGSLRLLGDSGPLIGFVLTFCGLTVLLVYALVARLSGATQAPTPATAPETRALAPSTASPGPSPVFALIQEANQQLAKSPTLASQRVKSTITDFPLYFVLGAGGSGKTSLFLASKFEPELLAGQVNRESVVVPTRLGNIWFADGAVVVEGAGDFFSGEDSRWKDFLASFHRPGGKSRFARIFGANAETKLSGVLLCCDAGAFVGVPDSARLAAMGRLAQQRLRVIGEVFGRDFSVHVVLTKSDSIPYFGEYFGRLTESEDSQVLGCTFPEAAAAQSPTNEAITAGLNKLYLSLADQRLKFLEREKDSAKRPGIYEFPRELKRLRGPLGQFLVDVFRANPLQPNPRLLGVYFTGTRKVVGQAADLDRSAIHKVGDVTRMLRADELQRLRSQPPDSGEREPEITRWSFVPDLWRQILGRRQTAGASLHMNRKQQLYRKGAYISVVGVSAVASLLFVNSFVQNHSLVSDVQLAAQNCPAVPEGIAPSLQNLRDIDDLREEVGKLDQAGILEHFGFSQRGKLMDPAWRAYYARFHQYFLDAIVHRLKEQLSGLPSEQASSYSYGDVYTEMKTYRTITWSPREASCPADSALVAELMNSRPQDKSPNAEAEQSARANFEFYVRGLASHKILLDKLQIPSQDDRVVNRGRSYLSDFKGVEPQYRQIMELAKLEKLRPARLMDLTKNDRYRSVMRVDEEVPAAFTIAGWDSVQKLIESSVGGNAADSCVLGNGGSHLTTLLAPTDLKAQLRKKYADDYIQRWSNFLANASVGAYAGCGDAAKKLGILKENESPILAVLVLASNNTTFQPGSTAQQGARAMKEAVTGFWSRLWSRFVHNEGAAGQANKAVGDLLGADDSEDRIAKAFQPAHAVFEKSPPNPEHWNDSRNNAYLMALSKLRDALAPGGKCDETNQPANSDTIAALDKADGVVQAIAQDFNRGDVSEKVTTLLESPLTAVQKLIATNPTDATRGKIANAKNQLCKGLSALNSKYPFNTGGSDADLDQVSGVFNPRDSLFTALRQTVSDFGDEKPDGSWSQKPDASIKLSREFWTFLTKLSEISIALFPRQGGAAAMEFRLSVLPNTAVKRVTGPIDGQEISMSPADYPWPGSRPGIDLRVEQAEGGNAPLRKFTGLWGIFKLLSNAVHTAAKPNQFQFRNLQAEKGSEPQTILPDGSDITLEVTRFPNGVQDAFKKGFFEVKCPARIFE